MIAISLVQDCDCSCAPYIQIKRALYKSYLLFPNYFFYCLLRPCWSKILTGDMALKHLRLNTNIGTWLTPQNPKWPYLKFRLGTYIPPAKRASQLVQDFWGGLNLALKFSSHNFHTKNLYSLGRCFEYKSESTGSNKFIAHIQFAQFPLLNNTLLTYICGGMCGWAVPSGSRDPLIFLDN